MSAEEFDPFAPATIAADERLWRFMRACADDRFINPAPPCFPLPVTIEGREYVSVTDRHLIVAIPRNQLPDELDKPLVQQEADRTAASVEKFMEHRVPLNSPATFPLLPLAAWCSVPLWDCVDRHPLVEPQDQANEIMQGFGWERPAAHAGDLYGTTIDRVLLGRALNVLCEPQTESVQIELPKLPNAPFMVANGDRFAAIMPMSKGAHPWDVWSYADAPEPPDEFTVAAFLLREASEA